MSETLDLTDFCSRAPADKWREEIYDLHEKYGPANFYHARLDIGGQHFEKWQERLNGEKRRRGEVVLFIRDRQDAILLHTKSFYPPDAYRMPTGGIHADESAIDALARELAEETSLRAQSFSLLALLLYEFRCQQQTALFLSYIFDIAVIGQQPQAQDESEKISGFRWISYAQLPGVIERLQQLPGRQWREWGALRAIPHQIILSAHDRERAGMKK